MKNSKEVFEEINPLLGDLLHHLKTVEIPLLSNGGPSQEVESPLPPELVELFERTGSPKDTLEFVCEAVTLILKDQGFPYEVSRAPSFKGLKICVGYSLFGVDVPKFSIKTNWHKRIYNTQNPLET